MAARAFFEEALALAQSIEAPERGAWIVMNLAEVEFCLGNVDEAVTRGFAAVGRLRALGEKFDLGWALVNLTNYLLIQDRSDAEIVAREALSLVQDTGGFILRVCLQQWALLAAIDGHFAEATRLLGFVNFGFETAGETRDHVEQQIHDRLQARLEGAVTATKRLTLALEGAAWNEGFAVKQALALHRDA